MEVFVPNYWPLFTTNWQLPFVYKASDGSGAGFSSVFSYDPTSNSMGYWNYDASGNWLNTWFYRYQPGFGIAEWRDWYPQSGLLATLFGPVKSVVMSTPIEWGGRANIGATYTNHPVVDPLRSNPPQFGTGTQAVTFEQHYDSVTLADGSSFPDVLVFSDTQTWNGNSQTTRFWMAAGIGPVAVQFEPGAGLPRFDATTTSIFGSVSGVVLAGGHQQFVYGAANNTTLNGAQLNVETGGFAYGVLDYDPTSTDTSSVLNYGSISGASFAFNGAAGADSEIVNNQATGIIYQQVSDSSSPVDMVTFGSHAGDYLYNAGTISESGASSPLSHAIAIGSGAGDFLSNDTTGKIYGGVALGSGAGQFVANSGSINGTVTLGDGAGNVYYGPNGHLAGTVVCGAGGDTVLAGADFESVLAGIGNDYFAMTNGGETVIQESMAQQQPDGVDVVGNFQTYNGASQGTFLRLDASVASSANFFDYNGGTLVQLALGGGSYSYVDVLGVGAATVESQTYFA